LCRVDGLTDRVALTFDDGPNARATPGILERLRAHGAHATFFTLAHNVNRLPGLARAIAAEGHELALHGDRHLPLPFLPPWMIRGEIERSADAVWNATRVRSRHYRPPFGLMVPSQARFVAAMGLEPVLGDVYPEDAHRPGTHVIVQRVLPRISAGSILILHDGSPFGDTDRDQTVEALALILEHLGQRGLSGVSVAELLGEAPEEARAPTRSLDGRRSASDDREAGGGA
jgi:peptidoglycan/xylan/chitin deacetylase (PgdA/CDA1 family)